MRSKASFKGHPLHAALIPYPFAFLTGAVAFDVAGHLLDQPALWTAGWYLTIAGIVLALVAAIPGFIDYRGTVPPDSSAKSRATTHMLMNLGAVTLFFAAWWVRGAAGVAPDPLVLVVEGIAAAMLVSGGWMGGTLVYRNQIGVDHRYARAGRWREQAFDETSPRPLAVAAANELAVDQMKLLHVDGRRVVLARTVDGYRAFDDRCPHKGGSLAGGLMACGTVTCPWHGSQFNVGTGDVEAGPAQSSIATYRVEERDGTVWLAL